MNKKTLFALWGGLFILCAGLGFIPEPEGALKIFMVLAALAFFVPPALLLYRAKQEADSDTRKLVRNLSALSLGLTVALLIGNFLGAAASETVGMVLHSVLVIVTSPMICSGYWALSLFLWACLLMGSLNKKEKTRT